MFDDVANIAMEATQGVQSLSKSQKVEQIHLYNLNGVYVPASLILNYMHQAMGNIAMEIETGMAAKAQIQISSEIKPPSKRNAYTVNPKISAIKVQITFLAGFITLINSLFNAMG